MTSLRDIVRKYIRENRLKQMEFAELISTDDKTVSGPTISNFLTGKHSPHPKTIELITDFCQDNGLLSRLGMPTDLGKPATKPEPVKPDAIDKKHLEQMGIKSIGGDLRGDTDLDEAQNEWEKACIIYTLLRQDNPYLTDRSKKIVLGQMFPDMFPRLSTFGSHE